jgi:hypothetical protein
VREREREDGRTVIDSSEGRKREISHVRVHRREMDGAQPAVAMRECRRERGYDRKNERTRERREPLYVCVRAARVPKRDSDAAWEYEKEIGCRAVGGG